MLNLYNKLNRFRKPHEDGFTLVELIIALIIIGILMAIAIPIYNNQVKEAVLATLKSDVTQTAGQVSNYTGRANESQNFVFNPCSPTVTFNSKMRVQSDTKNVITCVYYGNSVANTSSEKRQAYNTYEWCIQGRRTADINATWNYNSRNLTVMEGACVRVGGASGEEAIG